MLEQILNLVKGQAQSAITNNADIPEDKKQAAVETTTSSIVDTLKNQFTSGNASNILGLFGSGNSSSNSLTNSLESSVISSLTQKVGLSSGVSSTIAASVIPMVIGLISKKHNDPNDSFDLKSIASSFLGGNDKEGKDDSILGKIGGLFGK